MKVNTSGTAQCPKCIVVALGGNAIQQSHQTGTPEEQFENVRVTCTHIAQLIREGHKVVVTHGNGPQVGSLLLQQEESRGTVAPQPMAVCGAMSQGQVGYMIQQTLQNLLRGESVKRDVLSVVTQVMVDREDPAFKNPVKPVGPFYDLEGKEAVEREKGYPMKEVKPGTERPFRRVVASPNPLRILEAGAIKHLVNAGIVVIASGGGGIPVAMDEEGDYQGVDAVIDKDLAGEKLAEAVDADVLAILTDVDNAYVDYGTPGQKALTEVRLEEARTLLKEGCFAEGSMAPKVRACTRFLTFGGERAVITSLDQLSKALRREAGTQFVP